MSLCSFFRVTCTQMRHDELTPSARGRFQNRQRSNGANGDSTEALDHQAQSRHRQGDYTPHRPVCSVRSFGVSVRRRVLPPVLSTRKKVARGGSLLPRKEFKLDDAKLRYERCLRKPLVSSSLSLIPLSPAACTSLAHIERGATLTRIT